ncbi:MAG: STAS domain-containing protein [Bryobacterales bacterium]|nr:STAS domain-containing protein [Bryobacterales bacterium]
MYLKISTRRRDDVAVIDLSGPITLGENSQSLRDTVRELVTKGERRILLNMSDVAFLDSSGLAALISSLTAVTRAGGQLKLVNLQRRVTELIRLTRLTPVLEAFENEAEAAGSFTV